MSFWNKHTAVAIAALLSVGVLLPNSQAGISPSAGNGLLVAAADRDDWTSWGGALRGSPALRHSDHAQEHQDRTHRRPRSDFEQS